VAKGLYCAFLDADDRWASCKIERQVAALERHPEMVLCHTYAEVINEHDHVTAIRHKGRLPASGSCAKALLNHCFITISSVMVRRNAWLEAMSENELSHFGMDWDFFLSLARTNQFCLIDEPLTQYRKAAGAVSYRKWRRRPRNVFSMERIRRNGLWRDVVTLKEYKRILYQAYADNAEYYCYSNSPWRALYFCLRGVRYSPANLLLYKYALKGLFRMIHEHGR
jgi:glycosyltransferase involved in cell wall biosynthesis